MQDGLSSLSLILNFFPSPFAPLSLPPPFPAPLPRLFPFQRFRSAPPPLLQFSFNNINIHEHFNACLGTADMQSFQVYMYWAKPPNEKGETVACVCFYCAKGFAILFKGIKGLSLGSNHLTNRVRHPASQGDKPLLGQLQHLAIQLVPP